MGEGESIMGEGGVCAQGPLPSPAPRGPRTVSLGAGRGYG